MDLIEPLCWFFTFFSFFFSSILLGSPVQGKKKKKNCERKKEEKDTALQKADPQNNSTPLFWQTSVAKGQGDLHGEASKEKDTGWKWKDMRSTPLCCCFPLISIRKMACSFSVVSIPKQYKAGEIKARRKPSSTLYQRLCCSSGWINYHSAGWAQLKNTTEGLIAGVLTVGQHGEFQATYQSLKATQGPGWRDLFCLWGGRITPIQSNTAINVKMHARFTPTSINDGEEEKFALW